MEAEQIEKDFPAAVVPDRRFWRQYGQAGQSSGQAVVIRDCGASVCREFRLNADSVVVHRKQSGSFQQKAGLLSYFSAAIVR